MKMDKTVLEEMLEPYLSREHYDEEANSPSPDKIVNDYLGGDKRK